MNLHQLELQRDLYRLLLGVCEKEVDPAESLTRALRLIVRITGARIGYLELRNREGDTWWSKEQCAESDVAAIRQCISGGIIAEALSTGETVITPSAFLDPRFSVRDSVCEVRIESVLCSPFACDGLSGVVYLQGENGHLFDDAECLMDTRLFTRHITPLLCNLACALSPIKKGDGLPARFDRRGIIGSSSALLERLREAMAVAELDVTVLLTGETGTGKGAMARSIHANSGRKNGPFVHVNCANLPESLADSELFGAVKGAHSSAYTDVKGKIAAAKGGTLFLDEIAVLPVMVQAKLLQFLEDGLYYPLGGTVTMNADVRIIAAANINFEEAIRNGTFKEDLYYRLCVFPIMVPPLRERTEDIPALFEYFVAKYCKKFGIPLLRTDPQVVIALQEQRWNGNVRQFENRVQQGVLRARVEEAQTLLLSHLIPGLSVATTATADMITYRSGKESWERRFITASLEKNGWNISETAKMIDLSRSHLNTLIKDHGLERVEGCDVKN